MNSDNKATELTESETRVGVPPSSRTVKLMGSTFELDSRYQIEEILGTGAYGVVVSAQDTVNNTSVAIKKIERCFSHTTVAKRVLRELKIMRLMAHDNIIQLSSVQLPKSRYAFSEIYAVMELMGSDLNSIIKSTQTLTDEHCKFFLYQILCAVKYMHSACILHRDIKPRNILINSNCDLKICDFGLARAFTSDIKQNTNMTDYVSTRWYRAPELLLSFQKYTSAIDMWSIGTIFAELLLRKPLFPGTDANQQLELIFSLLGSPSSDDLKSIPNSKAKQKALRVSHKPGRPFEEVFNGKNPQAIDLIQKMLTFNPEKRITTEGALKHPYFEGLHWEEDEPTADPVSMFDFQFEEENLTIEELRELIYQEISLYHSPETKTAYEDAKYRYDILAGDTPRKKSREVYFSDSH